MTSQLQQDPPIEQAATQEWSEIIEITPALAAQWLQDYAFDGQRKLSPRHVNFLAQEMAGGRFEILHSVGANSGHGLRRTNSDKRRAVETLLRDEEWGQWSNHEISRRCGVGDDLVAAVRAHVRPPSLSENDSDNRRTTTKHGTTTTMRTANIGRGKPGTSETRTDVPGLEGHKVTLTTPRNLPPARRAPAPNPLTPTNPTAQSAAAETLAPDAFRTITCPVGLLQRVLDWGDGLELSRPLALEWLDLKAKLLQQIEKETW